MLSGAMHKQSLVKPDGRALHLYSRAPIVAAAPVGGPGRAPAASHLRWHPLRGEWVAYASHRQHRTFLPPPDWNPLMPSDDPARLTELPTGNYEVAVFENLFPTLFAGAGEPPEAIVETRPGKGACEVVVFTQDPAGSLGGLPLGHLELVVEVWGDRTRELGARDDITYVMPFENRGAEVGVTLHHPHGQIYAFPFVPPLAAREHAAEVAHFEAHGRALLADHLDAELRDGRRTLYASDGAVAFVPVCARYAYEVWIAPRRPVPDLAALTAGDRRELARALKTVLLKYDRLWDRPFPYVMVVHQAPTDGAPHPESHLHLELYPPFRLPGRLKYLAGCELGAGTFTADTLPEDKAAELRAVEVSVD
jgi:UDPglucose--hexose-1-phosphate uridylyltransferase